MEIIGNKQADNQKIVLMSRMILNGFRVTQEINRRMKNCLNLSTAKFEALLAIENAQDGIITMSNLSKDLMVSNANITGLTTRLQSDGLVTKKALPSDRRIYSVTLTEKGHKTLEIAMQKYVVWMNELMDKMNNEDVHSMNKFMDKMDAQFFQVRELP
jgi:DNA-binding MarR family transcriptional regulator